MITKFDIFAGRFRQECAHWVDTTAGFEEADQAMLLLAATKPGPYFIFDSETGCVGTIDTTGQHVANRANDSHPIREALPRQLCRNRAYSGCVRTIFSALFRRA